MANKKIWTRAEINIVASTITRDWECEGALRWKGETHKYYSKKKYHSDDEIDSSGIFFAFNDEQFEEGVKRLGFTMDNLKGNIFSMGYGGFGTREGIKRYLESFDERDKDIPNVCNPQEVYCYEFNNHECMLDYDGDEAAMKIILSTYGDDIAKKIKRYCVYYSIEEIYERAKK